MKTTKTIIYASNLVLQSPLTGHFYFCKKVKVIDRATYEVVGKKVDVTESLRPYLADRYVKEIL